ncbi:trypsin-like serine protease, partial [Streptomyces sp. NPDC035033]|uniref:trypsin-like serine protease n=1 Tax=Streptomyces sp. NPDC035033 TaxID=3155368 RepID=UPI00341050A2
MTTKRSRLAWAVGAVALLAGTLTTAPASALNGADATVQLNFVAKIDVGGQAACTGALVAPQWVITAATCFAADGRPAPGKPAVTTTVTVGRTDLTQTGGSVQQAVDLVPHPDRDVVLVRLAKAVTDTAIKPVRLAAAPAAAGEELTKAGFGRTRTEWVPNKLHTGTFTVASATGTDVHLNGSATATVCQGDAGGPALRTVNGVPELVAVNARSWQGGCLGTDPAETRTTAVDTRVDDLGPWTALATGARWGQARENLPASQELSGDFDGDGKTDTAVLHKYAPTSTGAHHTAVWKFTSTGAGTYHPVRAWDNLASTPASWSWDLSKSVAGDFNGDGRTDIAVLYDLGAQTGGGYRTRLWTFTSNGTGFDAPVLKWDSGTTSWNWDLVKPVAGDFDGDGRSDIAVLYDLGAQTGGGYRTRLWTFTSNGAGFDAPVVKWDSGTASWNWDLVKPVAGDFTGDGKADLAALYDLGQQADQSYRTRLWTFTSNGAGFDAPVLKWDSGTASWNWDLVKPVAGDFTGDGKADLAALYDLGQQADQSYRTRLWTFTGNGAGFDAPVLKWDSGTASWNWDLVKPVAG